VSNFLLCASDEFFPTPQCAGIGLILRQKASGGPKRLGVFVDKPKPASPEDKKVQRAYCSFGKFPLDCFAKSEPRHEGEAPFVAWLRSHFHMQHSPIPINVRYCTIYALSVLAIKEKRVNSVEDGDTYKRGA
jgi:hypothetical protein